MGKIISCRKKAEIPIRSLINIQNARRENGTGRSRKRDTETEEKLVLENREFSCQSPQWAARDDSQGLTHTLELRLVQGKKNSTENSREGAWVKGREVCLCRAGLEKVIAGR